MNGRHKMVVSILLIGALLGANKSLAQSANDKTDTPVLICFMPQVSFRGGNDSLTAFISRNLRWPNSFDGEGRVIAKLYFTKSGKIRNATIVKGLCAECDKEVLRVISIMPKWNYIGRKQETPNEIFYLLPVSFKLK